MHLTWAELTAFVGSYMWPFFRIGAMLMVAPVTGARNVPVRIRLVIALALTSIVVPLLPPVPSVDPFSLTSAAITVQQLVIGATMGLALQLVFNAVSTGGQIIAMQMGLGFASMVDPQNGTQVPVIGQVYLMFVTLIFLVMNGHLLAIELLVNSFHTLPIGVDGITRNGFWALAGWGTQMFAGAVWIALPAVGALLVSNIAFGVMARAAPQLNIFAVGFPVTMIAGFLILWVVLPSVVPQFSSLINHVFDLLRQVLVGGP